MNLTLCYLWKEWRAQRTILVAYALLVFTSLCLGYLLVPEHWWLDDGRRAMGLGWFVAAGVFGVVAFAAPSLVRSEFGPKDDQFVRRLPGALAPAFRGKLLFLVLAALALPLVGLLWGEVFLQAAGIGWHDMFAASWNGEVRIEWPWPLIASAGALGLAPLVWAIGTWLPGGRMALGGTVLLVLLVGVCVFAVLRQSPKIEQGIEWLPWLWWVPALGAVMAWVSWRGRRGGGPLRSARFGLATLLAGLAPPAVWLAGHVHDYHHPDPQRLAHQSVIGLSPDGHYALVRGNRLDVWEDVTFRVDLHTGAAAQVGGIHDWFMTDFEFKGRAAGARNVGRYWLRVGLGRDRPDTRRSVYDLVADEWTHVDGDGASCVRGLPEPLRSKVLAEVRERSPLRAPGDRRVWFEDGFLCRDAEQGSVSRIPIPDGPQVFVQAAGHGVYLWSRRGGLFDTEGRQLLQPADKRDDTRAWLVRDSVLFMPASSAVGQWSQRDGSGAARPCEALARSSVLGLFDDDHLLCHSAGRRLFLYRPADGSTREIEVAGDVAPVGRRSIDVVLRLHQDASLLARDPTGGVWLRVSDAREEVFWRVDARTFTTTRLLQRQRREGSYTVLGWPDANSVLVSIGAEIAQIDIATGARTVLFPRR